MNNLIYPQGKFWVVNNVGELNKLVTNQELGISDNPLYCPAAVHYPLNGYSTTASGNKIPVGSEVEFTDPTIEGDDFDFTINLGSTTNMELSSARLYHPGIHDTNSYLGFGSNVVGSSKYFIPTCRLNIHPTKLYLNSPITLHVTGAHHTQWYYDHNDAGHDGVLTDDLSYGWITPTVDPDDSSTASYTWNLFLDKDDIIDYNTAYLMIDLLISDTTAVIYT